MNCCDSDLIARLASGVRPKILQVLPDTALYTPGNVFCDQCDVGWHQVHRVVNLLRDYDFTLMLERAVDVGTGAWGILFTKDLALEGHVTSLSAKRFYSVALTATSTTFT